MVSEAFMLLGKVVHVKNDEHRLVKNEMNELERVLPVILIGRPAFTKLIAAKNSHSVRFCLYSQKSQIPIYVSGLKNFYNIQHAI